MTLSVERSSTGLLVPPRFATPRDPTRRTMGAAVARTAQAMTMPLMPWQRLVADVGGEVDDAGRFVYPVCVVTVQRQAGKTSLKQAQQVQRALQGPRRRVWDTAQTGQDARDKHRELADVLMGSPLRDLIAERRKAAGSEWLIFANGSELRPHPPTRDALHGRQSDHNDIDEGWSFDDLRGAELMQAITPTQLTRPGAQTWVWSTRGDRSSTWFHGLIERAYAGEPGIALFDWSIPDDVDPEDLAAIAAHHPAIGYTVDLEALRRARVTFGDRVGDWARAYGNRATGAGERVIPLEAWSAARTPATLPAGRAAYGIATAGDGSASAIAAAVLDGNGVPHVEILEHRPGRSWTVERGLQLRDAGQGIAIDRRGPAGPVADQLEVAGVELLHLAGGDYAAACQDAFDRITDPAGPRLRLREHEALDLAADIAERRTVGDGAWVWSRARSAGDVSTLEAATLAAWGVLRNPPAPVAPFVVFS